MFAQVFLLTLLATPHSTALEQATWPSEKAAVLTSQVSQYDVVRHSRSVKELTARAALALSMFTEDPPDPSRLERWAKESLGEDPAKRLQLHPFPQLHPGLVVMYQPLYDDLLVMELESLHRPPPVKLSKDPVSPETGVGEDAAFDVMKSTLDKLSAKGLIKDTHSVASAQLGLWKERSRAEDLSAEWVMEYQWTMNRVIDGIEFIDAGVRIGVHHEGHLSSLRITDVKVSKVPNSSLPVTVDLLKARSLLLGEESTAHPKATVHVDQERLAVMLDPELSGQTLTPGILFNYSLRFEDTAANVSNASRQILTSVEVTQSNAVRRVFPSL